MVRSDFPSSRQKYLGNPRVCAFKRPDSLLSTSQATYMRGNFREEAEVLYGDNRGCPRPWTKEPQMMDLSPIDIPELDEYVIRRKSACDPQLRSHAKSILEAKGRLRLAPHPFLFKHKLRLCLTDRWHQLLGKKSHKRASCQQHLSCLIRTLTHHSTSFMEALNARQKKRLRTFCTANPVHVIPFYHKVMYWENRRIIRHQEALLDKCCRPGEVVEEDEVFRFAIVVCKRCRRPGHVRGECPGADGEGIEDVERDDEGAHDAMGEAAAAMVEMAMRGDAAADSAADDVHAIPAEMATGSGAEDSPHMFQQGELVLYRLLNGDMVHAKVVNVDMVSAAELGTPDYTILLDGAERQVEASRLQPLLAV